ncbi:MAG: hypothetical protein VXZ75_04160, partial [Candidatus Thermoplasmatota archaeon]|nr:hypothetical protein [Candidatus Thermoplasmatota archaeon]
MDNGNGGQGVTKAQVIAMAMVILFQISIVPTPSMLDGPSDRMESSVSNQLETYSLYLTTGNNLSTVLPSEGGQLEASALDTSLEFTTNVLMQSLQVVGDKRQTGGGSQYYIPLNIFLKAEGPQNSIVTWTFSLQAGGSTVATGELENEACSGFGGCDFEHEAIDVDLTGSGGSSSFTVSESDELVLVIRAEMTGCGDGGFFNDCDARVAFNQISGDSRYSLIDISTNAVSDTVFFVQRPGDEFIDGAVVDWYPNDVISDREMQFSFDVKSAFGRKDIESVELRLRYTETNQLMLEKDLTPVPQQIEWTTEGLFGRFKWTYQSGLESGDYEAELRVTDVQSNVFTISHETIKMNEFGVSLKHS